MKKTRSTFLASLLAAAALHAVFLFSPFPAGREEVVHGPIVEITLSSGPVGDGDGGSGSGSGRGTSTAGGGSRAPATSVAGEENPPPYTAETALIDGGSGGIAADTTAPDPSSPVIPDPMATDEATGTAGTADVALQTPGTGYGTGETGNGIDGGSGGGSGSGAGPGSGSAVKAPGGGGSSITAPRPLADIQPEYPRRARKAGWEGTVRVRALISEAGTVESVEISSSCGHAALDEAALAAVRVTVFTPARKNGVDIPCRLTIPITFRLE